MKIAFFVATDADKKFYTEAFSGHQLTFYDGVLTEGTLPDESDYDVISVFIKSKISKKVIDYFPNLKLITVRATGVDNVDCEYAKQKGITVCNVAGYGTHPVAEFTFGLMLALIRKIIPSMEFAKQEKRFIHDGFSGINLSGKTLGVVGTGAIGANVIKIALGFGMRVLATDPYPNNKLKETLTFEYVQMEELLSRSDIVSLHCPATTETHHLINSDTIALMKEGSYLINTARGSVVEIDSLLKALDDGHLQGAALDVLENEEQIDDRVLNNPNILITPHIAFDTTEAEDEIRKSTVNNILAFLNRSSENGSY